MPGRAADRARFRLQSNFGATAPAKSSHAIQSPAYGDSMMRFWGKIRHLRQAVGFPLHRQIEYNGISSRKRYEHQGSRAAGKGFDGNSVANHQRIGQGDAEDEGTRAARDRGIEVLPEHLGARAGIGQEQSLWADYFRHHQSIFS